MDNEKNIQQLKDKVEEFCEERDWDQYHNAKELAIGISTEAAELLDHFRFKSKKEVEEIIETKKEEISEEMADVLFFLLRLAQRYNIDISTALNEKLKKSGEKYPIEKAKGSNKKYTEL